MHASEMVHIQFNEANGDVQVINNKPEPVTDAVARVASTTSTARSLRARDQADGCTRRGHQPRPVDFPANCLGGALHQARIA
jgi:hypothetical protein